MVSVSLRGAAPAVSRCELSVAAAQVCGGHNNKKKRCVLLRKFLLMVTNFIRIRM